MTDEAAFLSAIRAAPADAAPRLVYADWLEERGDGRAEFVRLQHQLAAALDRLDGFLHWGLNQYHADPFAQSVVDHTAAPGTENRLPAGDTHVLYPGPDGPWSSVRFEAHRIGLVEQLADDPATMIAALCDASPHSIREAKRFVRRVLDGQVEDDPETLRIFAEAFTGPDFLEGTSAFVEKRKPGFHS